MPSVGGTEEGRCALTRGEGRPATDLRCLRLRQEAQGQHLTGRPLDLARRAEPLAPQGSTRGLRAQGLGEVCLLCRLSDSVGARTGVCEGEDKLAQGRQVGPGPAWGLPDTALWSVVPWGLCLPRGRAFTMWGVLGALKTGPQPQRHGRLARG